MDKQNEMEVPKGWQRKEVMRKNGIHKGKMDIYIISPKGKIFRSKKELSIYISENKLDFKINDFNFSKKKIAITDIESCVKKTPQGSERQESSCLTEELNVTDSTALCTYLNCDMFDTPKTSKSSNESDIESVLGNTILTNDTSTPVLITKTVDDFTNNTRESQHATTLTKNDNLGICIDVLSNNYVPDDMIQNYFQMIDGNNIMSSDVAFLSPAVSQALKCLKDSEFAVSILELENKSYIFIPVSDSKGVYAVSGQHWSLLLYVKQFNTFFHFDSIKQLNLSSAKKIVEKFSNEAIKSPNSVPSLKAVQSPQQKNGVDCGVYVALAVDWLLKSIKNGTIGVQVKEDFTNFKIEEHEVILKRSLFAYLSYNNNYQKLATSIVQSLIFNTINTKQELSDGNIKQNKNPVKLTQTNNVNLKSDEYTYVKTKRKHSKSCKQPEADKTYLSSKENLELNYVTPVANKYHVLENLCDKTTQSSMEEREETISKSKNKSRKIKRFQSRKINFEDSSYPMIKAMICSDSQGKELAPIINAISCGKVDVFGYVRPNITLTEVVDSSTFGNLNTPLIVIGGTNDSFINDFSTIYTDLEKKLSVVSKSRPVFIATIPLRYDTQIDSVENMKLMEVNNYISELAARLENVYLIDFNCLKRYHFGRKGVHFSRRGKTKLAHMILNTLSWWKTREQVYTTDGHFLHQEVTVVETPMDRVIEEFRLDDTVGFAHSISSDFSHPRHMTAGVAVVFKRCFGKPKPNQRLSRHLALQETQYGPTVYSLITKEEYKGKPHIQDYNTAFQHLTMDFKRRGLKHLICSPIGCVRDNVDITNFVENLKTFQWETKAKVTIVSYFQDSFRQLRNGISHEHFNSRIKRLINGQSTTGQYQAHDDCSGLLSEPTPATSSLVTVANLPTSANENVCKVVPGVLTYCEASKQSKSVASVSAVVPHTPLPVLTSVAPSLNSQQSVSINPT